MRKVATDVAPSSADDAVPVVDDLVNRGSFEERLDKARAQREKVLAQRADKPDPELALAARGKPWEKPLPVRTGDAAGHRQRLDPDVAAEAVKTVKAYMFAKADPERPATVMAQPNAANVAKPVPEDPPVTPRRGLGASRVFLGFALGLALGLGLTWLTGLLPVAPGPVPEAEPVATGSTGVQAPPPRLQNDTAVPGAATVVTDTQVSDAAPRVTGPDGFTAPPAPDALAIGPRQADPIALAPDALPKPPELSAASPSFLPSDLSQPAGQTLALPALLSAPIWGTAPDILTRTAANSDLPLAAQPLPAAFTPATAVLQDAISPSAGGLSVHVLAAPGVAGSDLQKMTDTLGSSGYQITETAAVSFTVRASHVRFYHAEDAGAAAELAENVGVAARDFTTFTPAPPPGIVEIWLAGTAPAAEAPAPAKKKKQKKQVAPTPQPQVISDEEQLQAVRDRLLLQLQNDASP